MLNVKKRKRNPAKSRMLLALIVAGAFLLFAVLAPHLAPHLPNETHADAIRMAPCRTYPLGTDSLGRCVYSRVLAGAAYSIFPALFLVGMSFGIGTELGVLCGYYGGIFDAVVMRIAEVFLAFPQMVLAIAVAGILGGGLNNALLALGITSWTLYARMARSEVLKRKELPYVAAARFSGCSDGRILWKYLLPDVIGTLIVTAATQVGTAMMELAALSFLGIGVQAPQAEWGSMINEAKGYLQLAPWAVLAPAAAMIVTVIVFHCLGEAVRSYHSRERRTGKADRKSTSE